MNKKPIKKNSKIGLKIKLERVKRNLTQEELAEMANISRPTVGSIERGEQSPSFDTMEAIANAFGITVQELCNFDNL